MNNLELSPENIPTMHGFGFYKLNFIYRQIDSQDTHKYSDDNINIYLKQLEVPYICDLAKIVLKVVYCNLKDETIVREDIVSKDIKVIITK